MDYEKEKSKISKTKNNKKKDIKHSFFYGESGKLTGSVSMVFGEIQNFMISKDEEDIIHLIWENEKRKLYYTRYGKIAWKTPEKISKRERIYKEMISENKKNNEQIKKDIGEFYIDNRFGMLVYMPNDQTIITYNER